MLSGSVANLLFREFYSLQVIELPMPGFRILPPKLKFATEPDAGVGGNESRYVNHSCAPNCEAVTEQRRVYLEALRTIAAGEELTYDYQLERGRWPSPEWERRYACRCGAATCRGTMLAPPRQTLRSKRTAAKKDGAG